MNTALQYVVVAATFLLIGLTVPSRAAEVVPAPDPAAVGQFIDGVIESYRRDKGIAGVTVAVVSRDAVLLEKGYGFASLTPRRPVDPNLTLFRIASISKTFTDIMAMQLAAEGKLDLNAPADIYLPDRLKFAGDGFDVPRVLDLMQHTAGFEDSALGHLFEHGQVAAFEDYLIRFRPHRVRRPGSAAIYSNYGVALLGYIIAHIDGRSFEDSTEARIIRPLNLQGVSFREPADDPATGLLTSQGFRRVAGWYEAEAPLYISHIAPAASASATAHGMALYMRMLLNRGTLGGVVILSPADFDVMTTITFRNSPESGAIAHGFFRRRYGDLLSLEHEGSAPCFLSNMVVWPEANLAVFVSTNTETGGALVGDLPRLLIEHFNPRSHPQEVTPAAQLPTDLDAYAGDYINERRNFSSFEGLVSRLTDITTITPLRDGTLALQAGGAATRYVVQSADVLHALESNAVLRVRRSSSGDVIGTIAASGFSMGRKLAWLDTPALLLSMLTVLLLASGATLVSTLVRLRYAVGRSPTAILRLATATEVSAAALWLVSLLLLLMAIAPMFDRETAMTTYPGPLLPTVRILFHAAAALSLVLITMIVPVWRGSWRARRVTFTLYAVLALAGSLLLWRWGALLTPLTIAS